ncbi:16110_t:CDS:1, partial [Cetraspora pellucida]
MSFFKKLNNKFNKNQKRNIDQKKYIEDESQPKFKDDWEDYRQEFKDNWENCEQDSISWNLEEKEPTWSTSNQEVSSQLKIEQENPL